MEQQLEPMSSYLQIAKKVIASTAPKNIRRVFLRNDDIVSTVASAIMVGDTKWDGRGTLVGYRKYCGKCMVRKTIDKYKNSMEKKYGVTLVSLNTKANRQSNNTLAEIIPDSKTYETNRIHDEVEDILFILNDNNSNICNKQQRHYMTKHFMDNMSFAEIGREEGVSRERVRQVVSSAITAIRKALIENGD